MSPNQKARLWIWGVTLLAFAFAFGCVTLILSIQHYQYESTSNAALLTNLGEYSKSVQELKKWRTDNQKAAPDDLEEQWKSRYTEYARLSKTLHSYEHLIPSVKDSIDHTDTLLQKADSLHSDVIATTPPATQKQNMDFNDAIDSAVAQADNSSQIVRTRQNDVMTGLSDDWQYVIWLSAGSCIIAALIVVVMGLYQRDRVKIQDLETSLVRTKTGFESRVQERTKKISDANKALQEQITERKRAEEALSENEARYRTLVELSPDGVAVYCDDQIIYINSTGAKLFGANDPSEIFGRLLRDVIHPDDVNDVKERLNQILEEKTKSATFEARIIKTDGTNADAELGAIPYSFQDKPSVQLVIRDVTSRKRLEEQLRQSQKMEAIGRLAGGVAHDFNNLLTAIMGYSDYLLNSIEVGDSKRTFIEEIKRAGERAAGLTRQLLAFSRKQNVERRVMDLNSSVIDVEKMLRRLIGEDINLVTALDPELGNIKADAGEIEQIVVNLAVNARDAMPDGGKLTIRTANISAEDIDDFLITNPADSYVILEVSDTGSGMDKETQMHCLEPFFTTKESSKGTGLGLSTVYAITKKCDGHLRLTSEVGKGTTFTLYFPREKAKLEMRPAVIERPEILPGSETIIVVEDDSMVRYMIREIMKKTGYNILEAANGEEALLISGRHDGRIDLIITDVVMPQMNGRELVEKLTESRPALKAIYISGYTHEAIMKYGLGNIDGAFMQKPFASAALIAKVREVLDQPGHNPVPPTTRLEANL